MLKTIFAAALVTVALAGCADKQPEENTTIIREENTTVKEVPASPAAPAGDTNTTIINNEASPTPAPMGTVAP